MRGTIWDDRFTCPAQIIQAVEELNPAELDHLADEVAALQARRNVPVLSPDASALFAIINHAMPEGDRDRLGRLSHRRGEEMLSPDEHTELLELQRRLEALHASRMKALAELAALRGVSLAEVMEQLGIQFPDHE
jgi:hypothetical protein